MNYKALLIGVNEYKSNTYIGLDAVLNDINAIEQLLNISSCGYQPLTVLSGKRATYGEIKKAINYFFDSNKDDVLFLYWAGHGALSGFADKTHFIAFDSDPRNEANTAIDIKWLAQMIEETVSETVVVVLDCCYSGAISRGQSSNLQLNIQGYGKVIMASSDYLQESYDSDKSGHGRFTECFLRGLRGEAKTLDGDVTVNSLHDYICSQIKTIEPVMAQTPVFKANYVGKLVLNRVEPSNQGILNHSMADIPQSLKARVARNTNKMSHNYNELVQAVIPKTITDLDKVEFMNASFDTIKNGLATILEEVKQQRSDFDYTCENITTKQTNFKLFLNGKLRDGLTIWLGSMFGSMSIESICVSHGVYNIHAGNSFNEMISCEQSGKELFLKMTMDYNNNEMMNADTALRAIFTNYIAPKINDFR